MTQNKYSKGDQVRFENIKRGDTIKILSSVDYKVLKVDGHLYISCPVSGLVSVRMLVENHLITDHRPAFDWGTVKSGDCFLFNQNPESEVIFIGLDPEYEDRAWCLAKYQTQNPRHASWYFKSQLTRHPQGDICEANEIPEGDIKEEV